MVNPRDLAGNAEEEEEEETIPKQDTLHWWCFYYLVNWQKVAGKTSWHMAGNSDKFTSSGKR